MDLLTHLVDKSLVAVEAESQEGRYRLPETIRQYARDKLFESGEAEQVRDRHLEFFLQFAQAAEPKLRGAEQIEWLNRVESEHDNVRTARWNWPERFIIFGCYGATGAKVKDGWKMLWRSRNASRTKRLRLEYILLSRRRWRSVPRRSMALFCLT
jgi:hypothetical protein